MDTATTVTYKCPNCDAGLTFDAEKQKFCCEFCLSEFTEAELANTDAANKVKQEEEAQAEFCEHMNEYHCPNCGAEIAASENTAVDFCYFCHNPIVLVGKLSGQARPNKVIPFKFDKKAAEEIFLKNVRKKWFVPRDFSSQSHADKISGVYFPFWVTDADTYSSMEANATKVRTWRSGKYEYTEVSNFRIHRAGKIHFEDIVTSAISDEDKHMLEGILPYPSDSLTDFSVPYLLGFTAKKRDINRDQLVPEVRGRISNYTKTLFTNTIVGYTSVIPNPPNINIQKSHWEYALMPIWILTYKHGKKGKVYTYAMNGYTEKIYGEWPISWAKIAILFGSVLTGIATIAGLIGGFLL